MPVPGVDGVVKLNDTQWKKLKKAIQVKPIFNDQNEIIAARSFHLSASVK